MKKNRIAYLEDVFESITRILTYTKDFKSQDELASSKMALDAVVRNFQVMGEATKRIDHEFRKDNPMLPWKKMTGFRDILIHEYDRIEIDILWDIVVKELPSMKDKLERFLSKARIESETAA